MSERRDPTAVIKDISSVSDKIRALDRAGYSRSEIAAFLGKRYQHVRNVLVDDERRAGQMATVELAASAHGGVAATTAPFVPSSTTSTVVRLEVGRDGRVQLPPPLMAALGVAQGGNIVASVDSDGGVNLLGARQSLQRVRALLQVVLPSCVSLADELIADRRAEVIHERRND